VSHNLEVLENWFPAGTAEGERALLERVFVYVDELKRVLSPRAGNPYLLVGRKGTGKSAIVEFAVKLLQLQQVPAIILRPKDIPTSDLSDGDAMGDLKRKFYNILLSSVASKLSESPKGILVGDNAILYNEAVNSGNRSPDFIGRIARSLPGIAKPAIKADLTAVYPVLTSVVAADIQRAIANRLTDKRFHIFIDDTDQVANPEKPGHLNRVWGLILAVRDLASEVPEICAVITLREEIWQRLRHEGAAQRDQTDHFTNLVVRTSSSDEHVQRIIETRLRGAAAQCHSNDGLYSPFFEGQVARAPQSPDPRSWPDLILVRSRQRPRDAIQLIAKLAEHALAEKRSPKIDEQTFQSVMPAFSEERAILFAQEVSEEFPAAMEVLRSFATANYREGGFRLAAEDAKSHLRSITSSFRIEVYGRAMRPDRENDVFEIWRFLYNANFLNGRISDDREKDGYRHINASNDPMLVTKARWNEIQGMLWEVNPAFRDFLVSRQADQKAKTGLPTRKSRLQRRASSRRD